MKKKEIIEQLNKLSINKNNYIVVGRAALVLQDIIEETEIIDLSCELEFFNKLDLEYKIGNLGNNVKFIGKVEFRDDFYKKDRIKIIEGFRVLIIDDCYDMICLENKKKDKKLKEKLEYLLCSENNFYWYEKKLRDSGIQFIAGVDEVGRGPLVGPVVAACVVLPEKFSLEGLTDSKKLSEKKRDYFYEEIKKQALGIGIGIVDEKKIDEVNIYEATKIAMKQAIDACLRESKIEHILIDAMPLELKIPTTSIIKGDLKSITISAASVVAKVTRDRMLYELDEKYPMYDFKENKGYPTKKHLQAIEEFGIIEEHRRSYGPVKEYLLKNK